MSEARSQKRLLSMQTILLLFIALGYALRIYAIAYRNPMDWLVSDGLRHWQNGEKFLSPGVTEAIDPFLYQFVMFLLRQSFGDSRLVFGLFAAILSLSMPWFWYRFAREVLPEKRSALWVWLLVTWTPELIFNFSYFMNESLLLPLFALGMWLGARAARKKTPYSVLWASIVWALASQTRIVALPFAAISLGHALIKSGKWKYTAIILAIFLLSVIPQASRSKSVLGFSAPFGSDVFNRIYFVSAARRFEIEIPTKGHWIWGTPSLYVQPFEPLWDWSTARRDFELINIDIAKGDLDWILEYRRVYRENYRMLPAMFMENWIHTLFSPSWPEANKETWDGLLTWWSRWMWAPLIFISFFLSVSCLMNKGPHLVPLAAVVGILVLFGQMSAIAEGRFRKPVEGLLYVAVFYVVQPGEKRNRSSLSHQTK